MKASYGNIQVVASLDENWASFYSWLGRFIPAEIGFSCGRNASMSLSKMRRRLFVDDEGPIR